MHLLKVERARGRATFMLRSVLILAILVPGFVAALRNRHAALLMYLWFALFRPQDWIWIDITSLRLSMVLGIVLLVPSIATGLLPNIGHPISIGMILFLMSSLLSQMSAVRPDIGWIWVDFLFRLFLACLMLVTLSSTPKKLTAVIAVIGGSLGFHAAKAGLAFVVGGGTRFADGLAGAFVDNNGYALGAVMILPLLLATAQNIERLVPAPGLVQTWARRGFYASVPLCMFAVIGTYSRGGFISLSAALLVFMLLQRRRFTSFAVVLSAVTIVLSIVPIPDKYLERLQTIRTYDQKGTEDAEGARESAQSRPHFWRVGIDMGMSRPFGVGLRQYEAAYDQYDFLHGRYGRQRAVHSAHVQVFAELGFFGAAVWAGLFAYAFVACLRIRARSRTSHLAPDDQNLLFTVANALIVSMTGFLVGGSFLALALNDITWLTFGMVASLDRLSIAMCAAPAVQPVVTRQADVPLAFRVVDSFAAVKGGQA
jgi:putative inorganic carbon (HCO3(-)) transporter